MMDASYPGLKSIEKEALKTIKEVFESLTPADQEILEADVEIDDLEIIPTTSRVNVCKLLSHARYVKPGGRYFGLKLESPDTR